MEGVGGSVAAAGLLFPATVPVTEAAGGLHPLVVTPAGLRGVRFAFYSSVRTLNRLHRLKGFAVISSRCAMLAMLDEDYVRGGLSDFLPPEGPSLTSPRPRVCHNARA